MKLPTGSANNAMNAWDNDYSSFPYSLDPTLSRGGCAGDGIIAGIFAFDDWTGQPTYGYGFRPTVINDQ